MSKRTNEQLKCAVVGFDSSHCLEFASRLIGKNDIPDQNLGAGDIVAAFPGGSGIGETAAIPERTAIFKDWGATIVDRIEDLLDFELDGVFINSIDGRVHLEQARPFLEAGIRTFVDKPFTCDPAEAREIQQISESTGTPAFSSSSARFDTAVAEAARLGNAIRTVDAYGPAMLEPSNPGLYWYGIHTVESLYTLMGPGCQEVACCFDEACEVVTAVWDDSRIATVRGLRIGCYAGGALYGTQEGVMHLVPDMMTMHFELLKRIVDFFRGGEAPVPLAETVELIGFIDAALKSANRGGAWVKLSTEN